MNDELDAATAASVARLKASLAASPGGVPFFHFRERPTVSIQVANPGGKAERAEVLGRLKGLYQAARRALQPNEISEDERAQAEQQVREEMQSILYALLGSYPTGEEIREVIGE